VTTVGGYVNNSLHVSRSWCKYASLKSSKRHTCLTLKLYEAWLQDNLVSVAKAESTKKHLAVLAVIKRFWMMRSLIFVSVFQYCVLSTPWNQNVTWYARYLRWGMVPWPPMKLLRILFINFRWIYLNSCSESLPSSYKQKKHRRETCWWWHAFHSWSGCWSNVSSDNLMKKMATSWE